MTSAQGAVHPRQFRWSVLNTALVAMATWWGLGLPYSLFGWLLDPEQRRWVLICYAWEVPVAGTLGPVLFPMLWFRRIEQRWEEVFGRPGGVDQAEAAALEGTILDYPMRVGLVLLVTSLIGYGVGAVQLRVFAELPVTEIAKIMVLGLATGLIGALFVFLYLEWLLGPLLQRFSSPASLAPAPGRRVPLYAKVFACALILTLTAMLLLGTIFYSRGERVLEEEIGRRVLASTRELARDLEREGTAVFGERSWAERAGWMQLGRSGYAALVDTSGTIVAGASGRRRLSDEGFRAETLEQALSGRPGYQIDRVFAPRIVASVPLASGGARAVTVVTRADFETELDSMLGRGVVVFAASLLLALVQGFLFSRRLIHPIEVVTGMASNNAEVPRGPWDTVPVRTNDEVGELAAAFNRMIARLEEARSELERHSAELQRRVAEATRNIATLYEVARTTTSTLETEDVLELVAEKTLGTLNLERLAVLWHPADLRDVVDAYVARAGEPGVHLELEQSVDLDALCPASRPAVTETGSLAGAVPPPVASRLDAPRMLCLPLVFKDELLGVILAGLEANGGDPDLELAAALASQAAVALANAGLFETARRKEAELRRLSQLRAHMQEESLRNLSRELHDGFGQVLTVVNMDLGMIERAADLDAGSLRARLHDVREQVTSLLQEVRTMSQVLRPTMLDFGLVPTIQWFVEKFTARTRIGVTLHMPPEETRLPDSVELVLYRATQEALTNVMKHAQAQRVDIELTIRDGEAVLTVADDGVGFEAERFRRTPASGGVGLLGMRERVAYHHGRLEVHSRPNAGVRITITIPLDEVVADGGAAATA